MGYRDTLMAPGCKACDLSVPQQHSWINSFRRCELSAMSSVLAYRIHNGVH